MPYKMDLIRRSRQESSNWSGGTTTQIAIYPPHAVYSQRNFAWRLSSACIDLEQSVFTCLPGFWRLIMVLEGEMRLEHAGHHTKHLKPFEQDSFSGDWTTTSFGKVRDFNLMLAAGCTGQLTAVTVQQGASLLTEAAASDIDRCTGITAAFYCVDGLLSITMSDQHSYELSAGDLLLLTAEGKTDALPISLSNNSSAAVHLIRVDIKYPINNSCS